MNRILTEIKRTINENMAAYLPHVKNSDLEKDGAVFYMNGRDGTEFDWHVNDKLCPFMVFYNDKDNLGAAKLLLYCNGEADLYLYDDKGKELIQTVHTTIAAKETELLQLAVVLRNEGDNKRIWDGDIAGFNTDIEISSAEVSEFQASEKNYTVIKNRKRLLIQTAYVSKQITEGGWKVGYMERQEPYNERDSGWFFAAGTEDDAYMSNYKNIDLVCLGTVWQQLDPDIFKYIDMPVGTKLIRISQNEFEIDKNDKEIYTAKR